MSTLLKLLPPSLTVNCTDIHSKKRVLEYLSSILSQEQTALNAGELFDAFIERERLGSTAIGHGVAIPHVRSDKIATPIASLLHLSEGVDFGNSTTPSVDLVLGLVVPDANPEQHLSILAEIAKNFSAAEFREQLRQAPNNQALYNIAVDQYDQSPHIA